jgi:hypothetical protein
MYYIFKLKIICFFLFLLNFPTVLCGMLIGEKGFGNSRIRVNEHNDNKRGRVGEKERFSRRCSNDNFSGQ